MVCQKACCPAWALSMSAAPEKLCQRKSRAERTARSHGIAILGIVLPRRIGPRGTGENGTREAKTRGETSNEHLANSDFTDERS